MLSGSRLSVLVLGVGGNVGQGILKALRLARLDTRVIGACITPDAMGLYTCDESYVSPRADSPVFLDWLVDLCQREGVGAILTGVEPVVAVLSKNRVQIEQATGVVCLVSNPSVLEIGDDKLRTCEWLAERGLRYPRYAASEDIRGLSNLAEDVGFPLVAKPRFGKGADQVRLLRTREELERFVGTPRFVVQEYLGTDEAEYTVGCFADRDGRVAGSIVMRRRLFQGTTITACVEDNPFVKSEAEAIVEALCPMGPCNIQMRFSEAGPVAFEINVRFSGTTPIRARFGFNEVEASLRHFVLGQTLPEFEVMNGVALRYWNELYIPAEALSAMSKTGTLSKGPAPEAYTEDYGR